jgi:hypothetical protein
VNKIWLARGPGLAAMVQSREQVRAAYQIDVGTGPIYRNCIDNILDPDHYLLTGALVQKHKVMPN